MENDVDRPGWSIWGIRSMQLHKKNHFPNIKRYKIKQDLIKEIFLVQEIFT